jgi:hypothetical protein
MSNMLEGSPQTSFYAPNVRGLDGREGGRCQTENG